MFQVMSMTIVAGVFGVLIRWGVATSPWGLLAVNVFGSFVAGLIAGFGREQTALGVALLVGFCGSLTTFSGYALTLFRWLEQGEIFKFALHFTLNNAMCLLLCYLGWLLGQKG